MPHALETSFAIPDYRNIKFALYVHIGDMYNLVIFLTTPSDVNWDAVKELKRDPLKAMMTRSISSSPWMYRCCDYSVGAFLGMIEVLTKKNFRELKISSKGIPCHYYELV